MTFERLVRRVARVAVRRPGLVIAVSAALALVSLAGAMRLELRTSNLDLVRQDLPEVRAFLDFAREFGTPNALVVVLEGDDPAVLEAAVDRLTPAIAKAGGVRAAIGRLPLPEETIEELALPAYTGSADGKMRFIFVQPDDPLSRADSIEPFVRNVRAAIAGETPDEENISVGLTGLPQYALDDRDIIQRDISRLSLLAFALVLAIFVSAFGALVRPALAMISLLVGVALTVGVTSIYPGHLTLLSAFFASILFGLGVDYGIHIVSRVEEILQGGGDRTDAIVEGVVSTSRPLATGAATTAAAFYMMSFSGFRGFEELGFIAGTGVLLCLASMLVLLPALLSMFALNARVRSHSRSAALLAHVHHPVFASLLAIAVVVFAALPRAGFDSDYLNLEPADSEASRLERAMVERSDLSPQFAAFVADDQDEAIDLTNRLLDDPTVGEVHSLAELEVGAGDEVVAMLPPAFVAGLKSPDGRYAVYAYPRQNVWLPGQQEEFVARMKAIDAGVTGMPILGKFMVDRSRRALWVTALLSGIMIFVCTWIDFRRVAPTLMATLPTALTVLALPSAMRLAGVAFNPLNVMALPVVIGIAVDNGVHIVHRSMQERGNVTAALLGTGRSVLLTSLTTLASFGSLAFTAHRGLASFAVVLSLGVGMALVLSLSLLPAILELRPVHRRLVGSGATAAPATADREEPILM